MQIETCMQIHAAMFLLSIAIQAEILVGYGERLHWWNVQVS